MKLDNFSLLFAEEFNTLDLTNSSGNKGWNTDYHYGDRYLNSEQQIYVDPDYKGLGLNPFSLDSGVLTITAAQAPSNIVAPNANFHWSAEKTYTSGLITSETKFAVQYGYFEISAKMPAGQGLWPAFWLLQSDGQWPAEYDVVEVLGQASSTLYATSHYLDASGNYKMASTAAHTFDSADGFHTYGMNWQADKITWYYDDVKVFETVNTVHDQSMYMLANLAVGNWPGSPQNNNIFPAEMEIDYIRVYQAAVDHAVVGMPSTWQPIGLNAFSTLNESAVAKLDWVNAIGSWDFSQTLADKYTSAKMMGDWPHHLTGNAKDNYLEGAEGKYNELDGGRGNDVLKGGVGTDVFVMRNGDGNDAVIDFSHVDGNSDKLKLVGFHFTHFDDVKPYLTELPEGTILRLDVDQAVLLKGVKIADLSAEQFIFTDSVAAPEGAPLLNPVPPPVVVPPVVVPPVTPPASAPASINFTGKAFTAYTPDQDTAGGKVSISADGHDVTLTGNTWKKVAFDYTVTSNTMLEFDFKSTKQGEIQGIGLETDNRFDTGYNSIQLYGTQDHADFERNFDYNGSGDWQTFKISAKDYAMGKISALTFINDHDGGGMNADSAFRNVKLYEQDAQAPTLPPETPPVTPPVVVPPVVVLPPVTPPVVTPPVTPPMSHEAVDFVGAMFSAYTPDQDTTAGKVAISADMNEVSLTGNTWKKFAFGYDVTDKTILEFDFKSTKQGEIQGIGLETDNRFETGYNSIQLYGTQDHPDFDRNFDYNGSGDWQTFKISAKDYASGHISYLTFINDHDGGGMNAESFFRNVTLYEDVVAPALPPVTPPVTPPVVVPPVTPPATPPVVVTPPETLSDEAIDFVGAMFSSYTTDQDTAAIKAQVSADGHEVQLTGNVWKKFAFDYTVTANTMLEFDFKSTKQGELQGIGLETDNNFMSGYNSIQLYGTQGHADFDRTHTYNGSGDWQTFSISAKDYAMGNIKYLTFINDHDEGAKNAESFFRNVTLYEKTTQTATAGQDTFTYDASARMEINGFGADDVLDISSVLTGYDPLADALENFVSVTTANGHTQVRVDVDGAGTAHGSQLVAEVHSGGGVDLGDLHTMLTNGNLIVS